MAPDICAVIFDNDGTLVDSESITLSVLAEMIIELGVEIRPEDPERFMGAELRAVFAEVERRRGAPVPDNFLEDFRSRQNDRIRDGLEPIDGAHELLSTLALPFCVASNAPVAKITLTLEQTGLRQLVPDHRIVSAYDIGAWKPDPAIFLHAAERLGVAPANCAVVEDSAPGLEAAVASGMQVFAYDPRGRHTERSNVRSVQALSQLISIFSD